MYIKNCLMVLCSFPILLLAATSHAQTPIDEIQHYDPVTGNPDSPHLLQTVTVAGIVTCKAGTHQENILYIQDDTGGIMVYQSSPFVHNVGDFVALSAVVDHNEGASSEVRLNTMCWAPLGDAIAPQPLDLTATEAATISEYIGTLVRVWGYVAELNSSDFMISDGVDSLRVVVSANSGISITELALADTFTVVGPLGRSDGEVRILPRDQYDLAEGLPQDGIRVLSYSCSNWAPKVNESWTMSFVVESSTPPAQLVFRYRYVEAGPEWTTLTWTPSKGAKGVYPTDFVGASYGSPSEIEWDFDDGSTNTTTLMPIHNFATGTWSVTEIQEVDPCSLDQSSPMIGAPVNIECVVVSAEPNRAVLMDIGSVPAKGVYPTDFVGASYGSPSEIEWDFDDGSTNTATMTPLFQGDGVRIAGRVQELNGVTTIIPNTYNSCYILSFSNDLPVPVRVPTGTLADNVLDGDCIQGEAFESVWVRPLNSVVMDTSDFITSGTYSVSSTGLLADALTVWHRISLAYTPVLGEILDLTGYMDYKNDAFQLVVGSNDNITVSTTGVPDFELSVGPQGFVDISPNPFNPQTKIRFNLLNSNLTQLNIYNLQGALVKQLVNERLQGGQEYARTWDGTDERGYKLPAGIYFARLRIGLEVMQVQKLAMVK